MADADKAEPVGDEQPTEAAAAADAVADDAADSDEAQAKPPAKATPKRAAESADSADAPAKPQAKAPDTEAGTEEAASMAAEADEAPAKRKARPAKAAAAADSGGSADTAVSGRAGLKLHHLRPAPGARRAKVRVGRGEASKGKTAGRGTKGTKARDTVPARFEGGQMPLHRRVPKLRGFSNLKFKTTYQVVNTSRLAELYPQGGEVTPDDLVAKGAVRKGELVKVLGTGDVGIALQVSAHAFSASAREKITAAGGSATEV